MLNNGWSRVLPASESDTLDDGGVSRLAKLAAAPARAGAADPEAVAGTAVEVRLDEALLAVPHAASVAPTMLAKAAMDTAFFIFGIVPILLVFSC